MKLSKVIEFLSKVQEQEGDIKLKDVTGFWTRTIPTTGERVVVCSVGKGRERRELGDMEKE